MTKLYYLNFWKEKRIGQMRKLYKSKKMMPWLALLCAILWALAYPFIKLGYSELGIEAKDLGSKVLFAGVRFLLAGLLVLVLSGKLRVKSKKSANVWCWLILFAIVNTSLHYLFSYIGLGYIQGSRGTVIDSMGSFFLILLSSIFYSDDKMSLNKIIGCLFGLGGIIFMHAGSKRLMLSNISFLGDGMILLNALCAAFGGIIGRTVSKKIDMTVATGLSMTIGGALLCVLGVIVRPAKAWNLSLPGLGLLIGLTLISAISFTIYNQLLANHPISKVAIYNAFIPVFGVILSCIILGETFNWEYLIAGVMVALGIIIVNI